MQKSRYILLTVVLLYFMHSQVTPYFHFHHHDHNTDHEFVISSHVSHEGNNKLCCKDHSHDHKMVEADWNVLSNAKDIKVNISLNLLALIPDIKIDKPEYEKLFTLHVTEYKLNSVLPKHSNKAPPLYI